MNQYLEDNLKRKLEKVLEKDFGKRCITKDKEDFPDTDYTDHFSGRCITCVVYEELDNYIAKLQPHFSDSY